MRTAQHSGFHWPGLSLVVATVLFSLSTPQAGSQAHPQSAPYHIAGKVAAARMFGEGTISTVEDEVGGSFSPDGTAFYFSRMVAYTTLPRLGLMCVSHYRDGHWTTPEALPFSGKYLDYPPKFDSTGKKLLFASSRPLPDGTRGGIKIWEVERTASGWGDPHPLPAPVNAPNSYWNADPSESADGTLYFSSDRGGPDGLHIYRTRLVDGKYSEPEKLGPEINSQFNEFQPYISLDGKTLIFVSTGDVVVCLRPSAQRRGKSPLLHLVRGQN